MKCHEVDYKIIGNDMQLVEVELDPNETVVAEAGAMTYFENGINFEAKMGDGSKIDQGWLSNILNAGKRMITGESLFLTHFTNIGQGKKSVGFAAPYPGKIVDLDLAEYGTILCQKDSFLAAALGTEISIAFTKRFGAGFFGGEGFILQKLIGDGMAFIHAGGTIVKKELKGESLSIDTGCLMAFTSGLDYSIERAGNLKSMFFGGEGLFLAKIEGTGTVWIQSMPFSRLADRVIQSAPRANGTQKGESGGLGNLGNFFD
ncbi:TIGR00266 family protein [Halobacteriovorax marinus]|uniref:TIGR00266 family protein n=1 Tax=Halobacteriovorax marinus TaxID=97084 RepID=A0A1Y5FBL4_9BACT|nr:TIGR00266 family protein [Halobacteriovorax marinus]